MLGRRTSGGRLFCSNELLFERIHSSEQFGQTLVEDRNAALEHHRNGRIACHDTPGRQVRIESRLTSRLHASTNRNVAGDSGLDSLGHEELKRTIAAEFVLILKELMDTARADLKLSASNMIRRLRFMTKSGGRPGSMRARRIR